MKVLLFSIQVYWSSISILSQKVLQDIEMLRAFSCSGSGPVLKNSGAKVSWTSVCVLKMEGGLGFRMLKPLE